jgi:hypothetical protein
MFEGTDLSEAYSGMDNMAQVQQSNEGQSVDMMEPVQSRNDMPKEDFNSYQYNPKVDEIPVREEPKRMVSVQQPGDMPYNPPVDMYRKERSAPAPVSIGKTDSFLDRLSRKRFEVLKVIVLAMIVLLAISMDRVLFHYMNNYLTNNILTNMQEIVVRISYPLCIILVIWVIKSM